MCTRQNAKCVSAIRTGFAKRSCARFTKRLRVVVRIGRKNFARRFLNLEGHAPSCPNMKHVAEVRRASCLSSKQSSDCAANVLSNSSQLRLRRQKEFHASDS